MLPPLESRVDPVTPTKSSNTSKCCEGLLRSRSVQWLLPDHKPCPEAVAGYPDGSGRPKD